MPDPSASCTCFSHTVFLTDEFDIDSCGLRFCPMTQIDLIRQGVDLEAFSRRIRLEEYFHEHAGRVDEPVHSYFLTNGINSGH